MDRQSPTLDQIPADRQLVEQLYASGKITREAKEYALDFLYPANAWGIWISRLLLAMGSALVLSGIIYFFAFNWAKITPLVKFSSIQIGMVGCLTGAYLYSLERTVGQVLLLSASVLTGILLAVFGQIYQTGADAYQLFMMWSLLTLGWTVISNFAPQWIFWLAVTNSFLFLWWEQAALPTHDMAYMIYTYLAALNGGALALREYFAGVQDNKWLQPRWIRPLLIAAVLLLLLVPVISWIIAPDRATYSIRTGAIVGLFGHGVIYILYRYMIKVMWSVAAVTFSICIIVEAAGLKILGEMLDEKALFMLLLMGLMTVGIFSAAVIFLRNIAEKIQVDHA